MTTVEIQRPDDETAIVLVDGKPVIHANHDDHGWAGIDIAVQTATIIAKALGARVVGS